MPETVPIHYNAAGEANGFGSKKYVLLLPLVATLLSAGLTFLSDLPVPHQPAGSPPKALRYVIHTKITMQYLNLALALLFGWIAFKTIWLTGMRPSAFGFLGFPLLSTITVVVYNGRTTEKEEVDDFAKSIRKNGIFKKPIFYYLYPEFTHFTPMICQLTRTTKYLFLLICWITAFSASGGSSGNTPATIRDTSAQSWGDLGNGYYANPILNADYSDPDVIRVGNKYYMICSEFHYIGMPVLESDDMVNWKIIGQVYDRFDFPEYDRLERYGNGSWAPALRYHDGKFWIFFCTPQEGLFMSTAENPAGPWSPLVHVKKVSGWEDPCPFWDEDGQAYLGRSQLGAGPIILHKMSPDGTRLLDEGKTVYTGPVAEGTKIFRKDGYYYFSIPEGGVSTGWQTILRSKNIYGPFERKIVLEQGDTPVNGPHQGALVDTPDGTWWFYHFQSREPLGRVVHLQPVEWEDGWPFIGADNDGNGIGEPVRTWEKPIQGKKQPITAPQASDDFSAPELGKQWQFNHNPVPENLSLTSRRGWLTLQALQASGLRNAKNTLTQKITGYIGEASVKIDFREMAEGQKAGLCGIGSEWHAVGIHRTEGKNYIYTEQNGKYERIIECPASRPLYLKISFDALTNRHRMYYSSNNRTFLPCGAPFALHSSDWKGARIGLFAYNELENAGTVYFDRFEYDFDGPGRKNPR